jgi:hypothetical protein
MLAGTIGSRPVGTPANARARAYIIDQLRLFGFEVRVQEADARRAEIGRTARVANIIAIRQGTRRDAIGLVSHYDSSPSAPGAADDALGVAVSLEAARVLAARGERQWTLMVLVTDGEEAGLMGAAALVTDPEVDDRLGAYLNIEAVGSSGPATLFETGPGNAWMVDGWARAAPHPAGSSFAIEVYSRLPNDTDFSILKRHGIPGLNFAPIGDSYAYHTPRDTPERLSPVTLRETGENVVSIVTRLDAADITRRTESVPTYFDVARRIGVSYGPLASWILAALALLTGVIAWVKVTAAAIRIEGLGRWVLTWLWTLIGAVLVAGAMVGATWLLRAAREVYHPWYARPDRLFLLVAAVGLAVGWSIGRAGYWLPARAHGLRHPLVTWSVTLPVWIALSSAALWFTPGAAYLWLVPLFAAGVLLAAVPVASGLIVRGVSVVVFVVVATVWLPHTIELLRFMVAIFGRLPIVTPIYVYAALMAMAGAMMVPPFVGATARRRPLVRPSLMTAVFLFGVSIAAGLAYMAPPYTYDQPLRRSVRALQETADGPAIWEVGSVEPGLDLAPGAPAGWSRERGSVASTVPWGRLPHPFVFRATGPTLGPAPVKVANFSLLPVAGGLELTVTAVPVEPGITVSFVLPEGVTPARSSLPGTTRLGRWAATFVAPPPEGIAFRASFSGIEPSRLDGVRLVVTSAGFPGGEGWQRLPAWLPQDTTVWSATATWSVPAATGFGIAPVPTLR